MQTNGTEGKPEVISGLSELGHNTERNPRRNEVNVFTSHLVRNIIMVKQLIVITIVKKLKVNW